MRFPAHFHRPLSLLFAVAAFLAGASQGLLGTCGPFTDTAADAFCPFVLEIFSLGITTGTTATTYDPASNVTRLQMAAFLSRTVDSTLKRGGRRAALNQFWSLQTSTFFDVTTVGSLPNLPASDGSDVWVPNNGDNTVSRVRASDGRLLETWTGAGSALSALCALGSVFVSGNGAPGRLYRIDPRQSAGAVTTVASNLGGFPYQIAFDGGRIWTANATGPASVSIVTPGTWTVTTVTTGFTSPFGVLFDGASVWVTNAGPGTLLKVDSSGAVVQTVTVGTTPTFPIFDGANIWVPNDGSNSITVVRSSSGAVLTTLTGNGLNNPYQAAFDGGRVLVTNDGGGGSVSLWKADDLTAIGNTPTAESTFGACSDGANFWITRGSNHLARF
ncbi:MAG TPA: S-layer homology domain-containing protein [Thermoanaerobaculia bacterium]|nr:S-layer homology domain-containing protein [Thermoanaerobaculia bacterium]